jgi:hypothetical protein
VHRERQLAAHRNGGALGTNPLPELEAPGPQAALDRAAGQDDRCGLIVTTPCSAAQAMTT